MRTNPYDSSIFVFDGVRSRMAGHREGNNAPDPPAGFSSPNNGEQMITEQAELVGVIKEFNYDVINHENMSNIDFNTRLLRVEEPSITSFETCGTAGLIPKRWLALPRKKKRNLVSIGGEGRKEGVQMVVGKREMDTQRSGGFSMGNTLSNMLGKKGGGG